MGFTETFRYPCAGGSASGYLGSLIGCDENMTEFTHGDVACDVGHTSVEYCHSTDYDLHNDKCTAILIWFRRDLKNFQEFLAAKGHYAGKCGWRFMCKDDSMYRWNNWQEYLDMGYKEGDKLNSFQYNQIQVDVANGETFNYYKSIKSIEDNGQYDHFAAFLWDPNTGFNHFMSRALSMREKCGGCLIIDGKTHIEDVAWRMTCKGDDAQAWHDANPTDEYADNDRCCDPVVIKNDAIPYLGAKGCNFVKKGGDHQIMTIGRSNRNRTGDKFGFTGGIYEVVIWQGDAPGAISVDDVIAYYQDTKGDYNIAPDAAPTCPGTFHCPECTPAATCPEGAGGDAPQEGDEIVHTCVDETDRVVATYTDGAWVTSGRGCEGDPCPECEPCGDAPQEGDEIVHTCDDGTTRIVATWSDGIWMSSGRGCEGDPCPECPECPDCGECDKGAVMSLICPDGFEIATAICQDGKWVQTDEVCPPCDDECPDCPDCPECPECPECVNEAQLIHTCANGDEIVIAECEHGKWTTYGAGCDYGEDCPPCPKCKTGDVINLVCNDVDSVVVAECKNNVWAATGNKCPEDEDEDEDEGTDMTPVIIIIAAAAGYLIGRG